VGSKDGVEVDFWRKYDEIEARLTAPVSARMLELACVRPGQHLLDLASGRGEPAIPAAHRVGPAGRVLGLDRNEGLLEIARERARREGLTNVTFELGDAEQFETRERFDVVTMRWALIYLANPAASLACVKRALVPGGLFVAAVWAEAERVEYATLPRQVLARFRDLPPTDPKTPGVSRLGDQLTLRAELEEAGFEVQTVEEMHIPVIETADGAGFVAWYRAMGGRMNALVDELPESAQRAWADELAREAERFRRGETISIGGVTHLVSATPR
jgi:SAM-dependent methyltransferase